MKCFTKWMIALLLTLFTTYAHSQEIESLDHVRRALRFDAIPRVQQSKKIKIAILDKAFYNVENEIGKSLPSDTVYIPGSVAVPEDLKSDHGVRMAQIVTSLLKSSVNEQKKIELRLYNAFGFTNFKNAIADAIKNQVDIVLYSEVWEFGGNLDGRGFINAEVDKALDRGLLWINATGNFAQTTYNSTIKIENDDWVKLPNENKALKLVCRAPSEKKCLVRAVLSWNDFRDDAEEGTDKDLDFALTDDLLNIVQTSTLKQSSDRRESRPGYTKYPREAIAAELKPGTYFLRAKAMSKNFSTSDRLRITVDGEFTFIPASQPEQSVLVPADNPRVLSVGAFDSDRSGQDLQKQKPELMTSSSLRLSDGTEYRGSSNSAAFIAALAAHLKLNGLPASKEDLLKYRMNFQWDQTLSELRWLRFDSANNRCFEEGEWATAPIAVRAVIAQGGKFVQTTAGWRIMVPFDPIVLTMGLQRMRPDDMITVSSNGFGVFPRQAMLPTDHIEIFAPPREKGLCQQPRPTRGSFLFLK